MPGPRVRSFAALPCTLPNPHHVSGTLSNPRKKKEAKQRGKEHFRMINTFDYRHTRGRSRSLASARSLFSSPRLCRFFFAFFFRRCRISEVEQQHSQHRGERNVFLPLLRLAFFPLASPKLFCARAKSNSLPLPRLWKWVLLRGERETFT